MKDATVVLIKPFSTLINKIYRLLQMEVVGSTVLFQRIWKQLTEKELAVIALITVFALDLLVQVA
jgi:hypothetical protein